jgi:hypothetical protein
MKPKPKASLGYIAALLLLASCASDTGVPVGIQPSFYLDGASTTCGGTGSNNENFNGVDRTCLT